MPRYFFNIHGRDHDPDKVGTEYENADIARVQAVIFAGDYLSDNPQIVWDGSRFMVEVRDEQGAMIQTVTVTAEKHG